MHMQLYVYCHSSHSNFIGTWVRQMCHPRATLWPREVCSHHTVFTGFLQLVYWRFSYHMHSSVLGNKERGREGLWLFVSVDRTFPAILRCPVQSKYSSRLEREWNSPSVLEMAVGSIYQHICRGLWSTTIKVFSSTFFSHNDECE